MQQTINCPRCGQPFGAILEQIIDAGLDPTAKERLISGRVNLVSCPHCGYQGMVSTPLMYHDPEKQMAIIHMPMELNLSTEERERFIGELTQAVMRNLPEDAPRGYLLQPGTALTMQGLVEHVLEAEGITREMLDAERRKIELIDELTRAPSEDVDRLIEENQDLVDMTFLQLLTAAAQSYSQNGQSRQSLRLLNLRSKLMETTEAGRELQAQEEAVMEATRELQGLGEQATRDQFVDLLVNAAGNTTKLEALAMMGRGLLDYQTFELFSQRVDQAEGEQKEQLSRARERMLEIAAEYERQSQAVIQQAVNTLRTLLSASDVEAAVEQNL
ncbi:MAG TPA: CpXC domain-containing protein, partial [Aggregatilineales bacterium]|nr:CpXC domain-containing protein [Aggregatilineales bacterium]